MPKKKLIIVTILMLMGGLLFRYLQPPDSSKPPSHSQNHHLKDACAYRYNNNSITMLDKLDYNGLELTDFKYRSSLLNSRDYYLEHTSKCPSGLDHLCLIQKNVLLEYQSRVHSARPSEAVIIIGGNSVLPEDSFHATNTYMNNTGSLLYSKGYDIYAPYVTHHWRFQIARRRLASLKGEDFFAHDIRRIKMLLQELSLKYRTIHLVGTSYGGALAIRTAMDLDKKLSRKLGVVVSVEGWLPVEKIIETNPRSLFARNWGMIFPGVLEAEFRQAGSFPNIYFAYGNCAQELYKPIYDELPNAQVIQYQGAHELKLTVFQEALRRYSAIL